MRFRAQRVRDAARLAFWVVCAAGAPAGVARSTLTTSPPASLSPPTSTPTTSSSSSSSSLRPADVAALAAAGVDYVPRATWDDVPVPQGAFRARRLGAHSTIVIHHSDFDDAPGPAAIKDYHLTQSGFSDIGYHFVVGGDGVVYEGRALDRVGPHAGVVVEQRRAQRLDPDNDAIGIVVDGNFSQTGPSLLQLHALVALVATLRARFHIADDHVIGHRDVRPMLVLARGLTPVGEPTVCPGEVLWRVLPTIRRLSSPSPTSPSSHPSHPSHPSH